MNRKVADVLARVGLTFAAAFFAFWLLLDDWRRVEASLVAGGLHAVGLNRAGPAVGDRIVILPDHARPFLAEISPSCSALAAVLAFAAITLLLLRGEPKRRFLAFTAAAGLVIVCNLLRIGLSIVVGLRTDAHGLVVFHDWVGTAFGLLYVLGGFTLFLWILLPSNRRLLKEYREATSER